MLFNPGRASWLKWPAASLRSYFLAITLTATIPMTVLAAVLITQQVLAAKAQLEDELSRAATAFALTVEREIASSIDALYILSLSEPLQEGDLAGVFSTMSALPIPRASWSSAFLVDLDGDVLFNTHQPRDRPLGKVSDLDAFERLKRTQQAVLTDVIPGPDGHYATGILVPVFVKGRLAYAMGAWISPASWRQLINHAPFSSSGFMAIYDAHHRVIARNQGGDAVVGRMLPELTQRRMLGGVHGTGRIGRLEGGAAYGAWHAVNTFGWGVVLGEQARPIDQSRFMSIMAPIALGLFSLLAGTSLAMRIARRVTEPLQDMAMRRDGSPPAASTVQELHTLAQALDSADAQREADRERLQNKADEFETLFQSSPIGLAISQSRSCSSVLRNAALTRMLGEPSPQHDPRTMPRTGWPEHQVRSGGELLPFHEQPLQKAARTGLPQRDIELDVRHSDGRTLRLIAHAVPLFDTDGQPRGAIASFTDITERQQAEASLSTARQRLRENQYLVDLAQEVGHVGFFNLDFIRRTITWTSGLSRLFGRPDADYEGPWQVGMRHVHPADRRHVRRHIRQACLGGVTQYVCEFRAKTPPGTPNTDERWLSSKVTILYDASGQPMQMHGVVVDITQQRLADSERARLVELETRARMEAEQTNRAKDEFLAMLGHELRNPLGAIAAATDVLNHAQVQPEVTRRAREIIARQTNHLGRLMDDLLDVARVISGKILLTPRAIRLNEVAGRVLHTLEVSGKVSEHHLTTSMEEVWVHADAIRMEQVITNLLGNALKYTPQQGDIHLTIKRVGDEAVLTVKDTGVGMPPELLDKAFDLFVQGERSLDRRQGGLGIGLTLVKRLVELHGGTVGVQSEGPQLGCTFQLNLPLVDPHQDSTATVSAAIPDTPRRIVLVEDNDDAREALLEMLTVQSHSVQWATDGQKAFSLILKEKPDVALVDLGLPGLTGYELARQLREQGYEGRLIALSGYGQPSDMRHAYTAGFDQHLVKPITPDKLRQAFAADGNRNKVQPTS